MLLSRHNYFRTAEIIKKRGTRLTPAPLEGCHVYRNVAPLKRDKSLRPYRLKDDRHGSIGVGSDFHPVMTTDIDAQRHQC